LNLQVVKAWVKQLASQKVQSEQIVNKANAVLFNFGSYRLGVMVYALLLFFSFHEYSSVDEQHRILDQFRELFTCLSLYMFSCTKRRLSTSNLILPNREEVVFRKDTAVGKRKRHP
jgi:hypothetical protein